MSERLIRKLGLPTELQPYAEAYSTWPHIVDLRLGILLQIVKSQKERQKNEEVGL